MARNEATPDARARPVMLSPSGPGNMCGKIVRTSTVRLNVPGRLELLELGIVDAEVVGYLMNDRTTNFLADRIAVARADLFEDRPPEQCDAVRR